jgi:hypothetical protein
LARKSLEARRGKRRRRRSQGRKTRPRLPRDQSGKL